MTDSGKTDEGGRSPEQVKKDLAEQNTPLSTATASGLAALGSPGGKETAKAPEGPEIKPDGVHPGSPPIGDQAKAAFFTASGSIPGGSVPSPSGPVPASVITDEATRDAAVRAAREGAMSTRIGGKNSRYRISDHAARSMSPAELRAVAHDRGYEGVEGGRNGVVRKFLAAQKDDEDLQDPPEGHHLGVSAPTPQPIPVVGATGATSGNPLATPSRPGGLSNTDGTPAATTAPTETKKDTGK